MASRGPSLGAPAARRTVLRVPEAPLIAVAVAGERAAGRPGETGEAFGAGGARIAADGRAASSTGMPGRSAAVSGRPRRPSAWYGGCEGDVSDAPRLVPRRPGLRPRRGDLPGLRRRWRRRPARPDRPAGLPGR